MSTQSCKKCKKEFSVNNGELRMYRKLNMPLPKECFYCRIQHLFAFWTFGKFRKGKSDLSGESLITTLPKKPRYPIYTSREWFSDAWDPLEHGQPYDPTRSFFEQFKEVQEKVPRPHQVGRNNVNCDWCDDVWDCKNCYLSRAMLGSENVLYSYRAFNTKDSIDMTYTYNTQVSYDITYCFKCFNLRHAFNCRDSMDSAFLYDCRNVQNCFMCWNLRNKQYCIENEQYSKEAYFEKLKEYNLGSWKTVEKLREKLTEYIREKAVHRQSFNVRVKNSTGNYLTDCDRCINCFHWESSQECYNCVRGIKVKDCIDMVGSGEAELCGLTNASYPGDYNVKYSSWTQNCRDSEYLDLCIDCEQCFGCVGLRKKKYCILNRQYSKGEYEKLRGQIIASMEREGVYGDFFPYGLAYDGYNLSTAHFYFPEKKEDILVLGGLWNETKGIVVDSISTDELPDSINEVEDDITKQPLLCPKTGHRFNIAPRELEFHRAANIPLPRYHFDYRTRERFKFLTVIVPYSYKCTFCDKDIETYYPPEWGYKRVACMDCYMKEVV